AALRAVHTREYLDFLRDAAAAWQALPDTGPEILPNTHPTPEMLANGGRLPAGLPGRVGWYTTDLACPIAPGTWEAAQAAAAGAIAAADVVAGGESAYALA